MLVTTPQAVSLSDVSKELSFTRRVGLPVLGLIENMSGYICPHCDEVTNIFGKGGGEEFCRLETEKAVKTPVSADGTRNSKLRFLGRVPVDSEFVKVVDGPGAEGKTEDLLDRYLRTPSSKLLQDIAAKVVDLINEEKEVSLENGVHEVKIA